MKNVLSRYRLMVLAALGLLVVLLILMVINLLSQLSALSKAAEDNMQWSISQIDTEFANLDAALTEQIATQPYSDEDIVLRINIALSRLDIITSGRAAEIFEDAPQASQLIASIDSFAERIVTLFDEPKSIRGSALAEMQELVRQVRPDVREVALLGVRLGAQQSDARRAEFAGQLTRTGSIAIALMILMGLLMLLLDRLLRRAARRDEALSASSRQLSATVAASLDAIVTANERGQIIDFNVSAERVFGWSREEIVGKTMEETFIPHRMREAHNNGMKRYLASGKPRVVDAGRVELAALRKSGEEFPVELNITSTQTEEGTTFIAYIRDISELKINEQKLIDARERAERTDRAKTQFLTVMSHEMRTPLNGILGVLDLLKTTTLDDTQARYAGIATSSSEVLLGHVNEALDITRIETGELRLNMQTFAMSDLIQGLVDLFTPLAKEKGLTISLDIDHAMRGPYYGDAGRIRQVLTNLIGNAVKFTDSGGVTLGVSGIHGPDNSSLRFKVIDTGVGISPDQQEQIFEDFFAITASEGRQTRGDGLGLSIARRIARAMDGDVSLKSIKGTGSTFVFRLPLFRLEHKSEQNSVKPQSELQDTPSCRVLIIEDNTINRSVLGDMLIGMGHVVDEAVNGTDGLEKAQDAIYDIIFMDISMPVMDGIKATQRLRASESPNAKTYIVGLTAHSREEYRERAVAAGMDRFHTKPVRLDTLNGVIADFTSGELSKLDVSQFPNALVEMIDILGPEKVKPKTVQFLSELKSLCTDLRAAGSTPDMNALAETVHTAKGGASLFGQIALHDTLATLENEARSGTASKLSDWADVLETHAANADDVFKRALRPRD